MADGGTGLGVEQRQAIRELIDYYDLGSYRRQVPVIQVARWEGWEVQWHEDISPCHAYGIVTPEHRLMVINEQSAWLEQRAAVAHLLGHVILGHQRPLDLVTRGHAEPEGYDDDERSADIAASLLLLPTGVFTTLEEPEKQARRCVVPRWIADARLWDWHCRMRREHQSRSEMVWQEQEHETT